MITMVEIVLAVLIGFITGYETRKVIERAFKKLEH